MQTYAIACFCISDRFNVASVFRFLRESRGMSADNPRSATTMSHLFIRQSHANCNKCCTRECCLTMQWIPARSRERSKAIEARDRGNRSRFRSRTLERFRWWRIKRRQEGSCQFAPRTPRQDTANGDVLRLLLLHAPSSNDDWPERADSPRAQELRLRLVDADQAKSGVSLNSRIRFDAVFRCPDISCGSVFTITAANLTFLDREEM